jgi:NDP-sugar pyrophosphorylase family protein
MVIQGAILAAGRGDRLRAAAGGIPKPLVEVGGVPMIVRQCRAMLDAGVARVTAIVNSETAEHAERMKIEMPRELTVIVRDTTSSMETMLAFADHLEPGWFLAATVDAIAPAGEVARFAAGAQKMIDSSVGKSIAGVLGITRWRGDEKPLFAELTKEGLISRLGGGQTDYATAGFYFLSTRIFELAPRARSAGLDALRKFLALAIESGFQLGGIEMNGVIDVDEGADLSAARAAVRDPRRGSHRA